MQPVSGGNTRKIEKCNKHQAIVQSEFEGQLIVCPRICRGAMQATPGTRRRLESAPERPLASTSKLNDHEQGARAASLSSCMPKMTKRPKRKQSAPRPDEGLIRRSNSAGPCIAHWALVPITTARNRTIHAAALDPDRSAQTVQSGQTTAFAGRALVLIEQHNTNKLIGKHAKIGRADERRKIQMDTLQ